MPAAELGDLIVIPGTHVVDKENHLPKSCPLISVPAHTCTHVCAHTDTHTYTHTHNVINKPTQELMMVL